jgi:hypothetical protein
MQQISIKARPGRRGERQRRRTTAGSRRPPITSIEARRKRLCISKQAAFLAAFRKTLSVRAAAEAARIAPTQHYGWLEEDPRYWEAFSEAQREAADVLQGEAMERAVQGWLEQVLYRGRPCATIRHYSDHLIIFLLKAWKPEKYR